LFAVTVTAAKREILAQMRSRKNLLYFFATGKIAGSARGPERESGKSGWTGSSSELG